MEGKGRQGKKQSTTVQTSVKKKTQERYRRKAPTARRGVGVGRLQGEEGWREQALKVRGVCLRWERFPLCPSVSLLYGGSTGWSSLGTTFHLSAYTQG